MRISGVELKAIDIATFLGMLITLCTTVLNLFQNKKSTYINNITRYRVAWMNTLRVHIATLRELSNITNLYISTKDGSNKIKYRRELDKVVSLIKMHLNFEGKLDGKFLYKIEELKQIINSYLLLYYYKNTISKIHDQDELIDEFNEVIDIINEKKALEALLKIGIIHKKINNNKDIKVLEILELKKKIKMLYSSDIELIREATNEIEYIVHDYENRIEKINIEIDEIIQIYLKAEWIRCKMETKMWPFSRYNEDKIIEKLQEKYKSNTK